MKRFVLFSLWSVMTISGLLTVGCRFEKKTELVQRVESYGSPNLATTSTDAMKQWFAQHPKVIAEILPQCQAIQKNAPASWGDSTEGRMCKAANIANAFGGIHFYPVN